MLGYVLTRARCRFKSCPSLTHAPLIQWNWTELSPKQPKWLARNIRCSFRVQIPVDAPITTMKATIVQSVQELKPQDPWEGVNFPCLIEKSTGCIALALSETEAFVLVSGNVHTGAPLMAHRTWRESSLWLPLKRPVTIQFEN